MRRTLAGLDPSLVHPALGIRNSIELRERAWEGPLATYTATLVTMSDSDRMPYEFEAALAVMNPLLDARFAASAGQAEALEARAAEILRHAQAVRDARSGMACDICLSYFDLALTEAQAELARLPTEG